MQATRAKRVGTLCAGALLGLTLASRASGLTIDAFDAGSLNFVGPLSSSNIFTNGTMIGGQRDETITNTSPGGGILAGADGGTYAYAALNASGSSLVVWDGGDTNPAINPIGLGGADFTDGATTDHFRIQFDANDFAADLTLVVYTSASDFSSITVSSPGGIPTGPPVSIVVAFADFTPTGLGADFSNVGAFSMLIDGSTEPQLDMTLSFVETTAIPEPGTFAQLALGLLGLSCLGRRSIG